MGFFSWLGDSFDDFENWVESKMPDYLKARKVHPLDVSFDFVSLIFSLGFLIVWTVFYYAVKIPYKVLL